MLYDVRWRMCRLPRETMELAKVRLGNTGAQTYQSKKEKEIPHIQCSRTGSIIANPQKCLWHLMVRGLIRDIGPT